MNVYAQLRQAILNRAIVSATYDGYARELCPHAIGVVDGQAKIFSYQFAGDSSKGPVANQDPEKRWRCMFVARLVNPRVRPAHGEWHSAANYAIEQRCIGPEDIDVSV